MSEIDKYIKRVQDAVGDNWNTPRVRLYIAACFHEYENHLNKLSSAYAFEKEVNNRAREMIRDIFINIREGNDKV